jgi:hypothetical protein
MLPIPEILRRINWLYHFTDTRNIPSIRGLNGLWSRRALNESEIAHNPGGNEISFSADQQSGMDDYVHLCFLNKHPMQYIATADGRLQSTTWLWMPAAPVFEIEGVMFSLGVSNKTGVRIAPVAEAANEIDYEVLFTHMDWKDPDIQKRRKHAELCEVLVPRHLPIRYFERSVPNG